MFEHGAGFDLNMETTSNMEHNGPFLIDMGGPRVRMYSSRNSRIGPQARL